MQFNEEQKKIITDFISVLKKYSFLFSNEKELQDEIEKRLKENNLEYQREFNLGENGIVDFYKDGIGFELKIKGQKQQIYRQCKSYCENEKINGIVLVTTMPMGLPNVINEKPAMVYGMYKNFLL